MARPKIGWFPISLAGRIVGQDAITPEDMLQKAKEHGFESIDIHYLVLKNRDLAYIEKLSRLVEDLGLTVSMLACSPDYTDPDAEVRRQQKTLMEMQMDTAHLLKTPVVRVTAGQRHPGVNDEVGVAWVVDSVLQLEGFASVLRIRIAIENHHKDPLSWQMTDFAARSDVFLSLYEELRDTPVAVNFNCASPMASGDDPIVILDQVIDDIVHVHAADWSPESGGYTVAGEGVVPFDDIFSELARSGFDGCISVVDGPEMSDEDIVCSKQFIQSKIERYWPT